jgi:hypothetical protein
VRDEAASEFHDADRMSGLAVVGDHAFADPQIPLAADPADGEVTFRRVAASPASLNLPISSGVL